MHKAQLKGPIARNHPNPLKRTNSAEFRDEKSYIQDTYSFYMYSIRDKNKVDRAKKLEE